MEVTREYEGAGLGLSISKAFVEVLGGEMWLDSTPGEGSVFYFTLPRQELDEDEIKTDKNAGEVSRQMSEEFTLLVAEDDETSYMLLREIMADKGINLLWAKNGEEALEKLNSHKEVDIVLMDIKMPVMDGYVTTREIKKEWPELPIITQTAYISEEDRNKAYKAGCDAYISKPIDADELMGWIREFVHSRKYN